MDRNQIKNWLEHKYVLQTLAFVFNRTAGCNYIRGKRGNTVSARCAILRNCKMTIRGKGNCIEIGTQCYLKNCSFHISGNNNVIRLEENVSAVACEIFIEDDNNRVIIGEHTHISGKTHIACIEGTSIRIGKNSLLSSEVTVRSGDSHAVLDLNGNRINPSADILIGEHVWIGNRTIFTKGAQVQKDSIVATGAVVTKKFDESNVILGGVPAKVRKTDINWKEER